MKTTIFKTITLKKGTDYNNLLKEKDVYVSSYAQDLIDKMPRVTEDEVVDLIKVTPKEMGLTGYPTTEEIFNKAKELGYELCPSEVGCQLRFDYEGDEWIFIGMEAITDRGGDPFVFDLSRDGARLELDARNAKPSDGWSGNDEFVFRLRKALSPSDSLSSFDSSETFTLDSAIKICKEAGLTVTKTF